MRKFSTIKYFSFVFCVLLVFAELTSSVPFYSDYENNEVADSNKGKDYQVKNRSIVNMASTVSSEGQNRFTLPQMLTRQRNTEKLKDLQHIRDLYELLLKKDALDDQLSQPHIISRKSNRSPSLRLRFGKKRDPYYANPPLMGHPATMLEGVNN